MERGQVTVQIMAGGRSSRMGRDKATVLLEGETLAMRGLRKWRNWGAEIFYAVGAHPVPAWLPSWAVPVADRYVDCGPLGGLEAGLSQCAAPCLLLCAVDLPFVAPEHAERLLGCIGSADACMYRLDGRPEPLFALYRSEPCLPVVRRLLKAGDYRLCRLMDHCCVEQVPTDAAWLFQNLNTAEDVDRAACFLRDRDRQRQK